MSFPIDPLPMKSELFIDGAWVDLTALGRIRSESDVVITRGHANEQSSLSPDTCRFTINNRDGLFSNRNPLSTYYKKLRLNVPMRQSITEATAYARFPQWLSSFRTSLVGAFTAGTGSAGCISTVDKAVLDITGDIDIRIDVEPDDWIKSNTRGIVLASKWNQLTNNRSWYFYLTAYGHPAITWSENGSAIKGTAVGFEPVDTTISRQSIRVTVDVNNGAGGCDFKFYTSDSVTGTWTQLGATATGAFTTSFYSGAADVGTGRVAEALTNPISGAWPLAGRLHRFQLYNGIAGTLVADMNATVQTPGATSWSDGLTTPNTWVVQSPAEISVADYRFYGEAPELPQEWDNTGTDVFVPLTASGLTRRLMQGESSLDSTLRRYMGTLSNNGFWPAEDGAQSTSMANVTEGGTAAQVVDVTFGDDSNFNASNGAVTVNSTDTRLRGRCIAATSSGDMYLLFFFKCSSVPGSTVDLIDLWSTGTTERTRFSTTATEFTVQSFDSDNVSLGSATEPHGRDITDWIGVQIRISDTGAGFTTTMEFFQVGASGFSSDSFNVATGTVGVPTRWQIGGDADLIGVSFSQIQTGATNFSIFTEEFVRVARAFVGEFAAERWLRILAENGYNGWVLGDPAESQPMGPQPVAALLTILKECEDVDRAMMFEPRDMLGYFLRTRRALIRQHGPSISYSAGELSGDLRPINDDQLIRNDVTVTRATGSSRRSVVNDGDLGVDAVGRYDSTVQRNGETDDQLQGLAGMETFLGTWDETRYPNVQVELARSVFLDTAGLVKAKALSRLDVGDRFDLTDLPAWLPPDDVALLIQGYREVLKNRGREFRWNTSPYGPYQYLNNTSDVEADNPYRRAAAVASYLTTAVDEDDLELQVVTTRGPKWGTTAGKPQNFPLDVEVAGEVMTVSAINPLITDAFGRTVASGLGTADTGGAWTTVGGSAADFNVTTGIARITNGSVNVHRSAFLAAQVSEDFDYYFIIASSAVATGASIIPYAIGRRIDASNLYRFEVTFNTGSTVDARIRSVVAGTGTSLGLASALFAYSAGTAVYGRAQGFGTRLRMKLWLGGFALEKDEWNVDVTDSSITAAGTIGVGSLLNTGNTNVNPETRFDDLGVINPQRFTVQARSVNGVVKSQDAEEFVQVKNRFYAAL